MRLWKPLLVALLLAWNLVAQEAKKEWAPGPLLPGEGLAVGFPDGSVKLYGEAKREDPMGSLAKLIWLRLEGEEWSARLISYRCKGTADNAKCWLPTGHGRVDLGKALQLSCNLAFLAWAKSSAEIWKKEFGEGAARTRLVEAFEPFLGNRLAYSESLPAMTPEWVGDGTLLRTTPERMLRWLMDPAQEQALYHCRRLLLGFTGDTFKADDAWWMKTGTAPVLGDPEATSAWVAGSNGLIMAVIHVPRGGGRAEGTARFQAVMGIPVK